MSDLIKRECARAVNMTPKIKSKGISLYCGKGEVIKNAGMSRNRVSKKF